MKAEELRIGNIVTIDNPKFWAELKGLPMAVTTITQTESGKRGEWTHGIGLEHTEESYKYHEDTYSQFIHFLKPIPLTKEWIEKVGLKHAGYNDEDKAIYKICDEVWFLQNIVTKKYYLDQYELELKFVHQLQNLYFALTGKELITN